MNDPPSQQQLEAATAYESLFVPALFQEWAPRVAAAAKVQPGQKVLDVACGTGVLAREVARRVGAGGSVTGLDPHPGMLAVAARQAPAIDWRRGAAEAIPCPDRAFDAVVSQFGLTLFADRPRALREMLRVLASGGQLAIAVWDRLDNTPAYAAEVALLERLAGPRAAAALRAPFALGDRAELLALCAAAGISAVSIATHRGTARFPSIRSMVEADLRGWLPVLGVVLTEEQIRRILEGAERDLAPYRTRDGKVAFDASAHIITGTSP